MSINNPNDNRLLTELEAAALLSVKPTTLRRWRWAGHPPRFIKIGAAVRYDPEDLQNFIEAGRRSSTSDRGTEVQP
ncbi:MAG: helix-turn-helix domain-containing protein [Proteobacteria bacterium]|nr:helix-turn-helix domain-containing protein [Pseudomonadota bacterium]